MAENEKQAINSRNAYIEFKIQLIILVEALFLYLTVSPLHLLLNLDTRNSARDKVVRMMRKDSIRKIWNEQTETKSVI